MHRKRHLIIKLSVLSLLHLPLHSLQASASPTPHTTHSSHPLANPTTPWIMDIAPYLWAINMHGSLQLGPERLSISQSFSDLMKHFQGGGMIWLNAHHDRFGLFANVLYSSLRDRQTLLDIPLSAHNNFGLFSAGVSYALLEQKINNKLLSVELLAGARYTMNDTTLNVLALSSKSNQRWTDPIVGARMSYLFNAHWQILAEGDVGGINNHHSYDLQGYIGYTPKQTLTHHNTTVYLGYRLLHQKYSSGSGLNLYVWNMNISGPLLGIKVIL